MKDASFSKGTIRTPDRCVKPAFKILPLTVGFKKKFTEFSWFFCFMKLIVFHTWSYLSLLFCSLWVSMSLLRTYLWNSSDWSSDLSFSCIWNTDWSYGNEILQLWKSHACRINCWCQVLHHMLFLILLHKFESLLFNYIGVKLPCSRIIKYLNKIPCIFLKPDHFSFLLMFLRGVFGSLLCTFFNFNELTMFSFKQSVNGWETWTEDDWKAPWSIIVT